jgi:hypothetical protein
MNKSSKKSARTRHLPRGIDCRSQRQVRPPPATTSPRCQILETPVLPNLRNHTNSCHPHFQCLGHHIHFVKARDRVNLSYSVEVERPQLERHSLLPLCNKKTLIGPAPGKLDESSFFFLILDVWWLCPGGQV